MTCCVKYDTESSEVCYYSNIRHIYNTGFSSYEVNNISNENIYGLGENLGLDRTEIDNILRDVNDIKEEHEFVMGSSTYAGLNYGTVSIKDF